LLHAICDALLGAACLGDIGVHFPDTSSEFKNIDSKILLQRTYELIKKEGYSIINIDSTLCLEAPKIKPFVPAMQQVIAEILHISIKDISIKATTTETMGFVGRKEGLVAHASCLLQS
jgi:2-C-methyl-D-erythritol 2,4-cyclodiphosphate synthase